ncbi:hypothetical protein [Enterococcus sp. N249-2]
MKYDTKLQATKEWLKEWNQYPQWIVEKMVGENYDYFQNITPRNDEDDSEYEEFFPMWGTLFEMSDSTDIYWLEENLDKIAECGVKIYSYDDGENQMYLLGIDGAGYDFYENHWVPLYEKRGLKWHKE